MQLIENNNVINKQQSRERVDNEILFVFFPCGKTFFFYRTIIF